MMQEQESAGKARLVGYAIGIAAVVSTWKYFIR
jgi:hypothetical protein